MRQESPLPGQLRELGYRVERTGKSQRILAHHVVTHVLTEGSTVPIRMTHAGIVTVECF